MKIFVNVGAFLRPGFMTAPTLARLGEMAQVSFCPADPLSGEALAAHTADADVLITGWGQREIHISDLGRVRLLVHTGGTVGGIVAQDVFDAGVTVLSGNRFYAESVAEGVLAYMLFALRDMGRYSGELARGNWLPNETRGLLDRSVGIVSLGAVSRELIPRLRAFRCPVKVYSTRHDPAVAEKMGFTYASLDEIFSTCDIVSVHTARTPETYHMIGAHHFSLLRDGALFLNTSRGEVIDTAALIAALRENRFSAVLDVYDKEPLPPDDPLLTCPHITLFPHQCGPTYDRRDFITNRLLDDVERFFASDGGRDKLENVIDPAVAARMTH